MKMVGRPRKRPHIPDDDGPDSKYQKLEKTIEQLSKLVESLDKRLQELEKQKCDKCVDTVDIKVEREEIAYFEGASEHGEHSPQPTRTGQSNTENVTESGNHSREPSCMSSVEQEEMVIVIKDHEINEDEVPVMVSSEEEDPSGDGLGSDQTLEVDPCKFMTEHGADFINKITYGSLIPFLEKYLSFEHRSRMLAMTDPNHRISCLMDIISQKADCGLHEAFKTFWNLLAGFYPQFFKRIVGREPRQTEVDACTKRYGAILRKRIESSKYQIENDLDQGLEFGSNYIQLRMLTGNWGERTSRSPLEMRGYDRVLPATYQAYLRQEKEGRNITPDQLLDNIPQYPDVDNSDVSAVKPRRLVVRGRAGIGKSTMQQWLSKAWSQNKWAVGFTFVFLLQLRRLPSEYHQVSLVDLLTTYGLFRTASFSRRLFPKRWLRYNSHKVIIGVDGVDEVKEFSSKMKNVRRVSNIDTKATPLDICINLIRGDLLPRTVVITTSRPFNGLEACEENSLMYEIQGHTPEGIKQYVRKTFPTMAEDIVSVLEKNAVLMSVCAITFYCTLVTKLLSEDLTLVQKDIWTYTRLTCFIVVQSVQRKLTDTTFLRESKSYFPKLAKLAYSGIFEHSRPGEPIKLVFCDQDLSDASLSTEDIEKAIRGGILQYTEVNNPGKDKDVIVEFIHLSVQELFAAARFSVLMMRKKNKKHKMSTTMRSKLQEISAEGTFTMVLLYLHGLQCDQGNKWVKKFIKATSEDLERDTSFSSVILGTLGKRKDVDAKVQICQMAHESQDPNIAMSLSQILEKEGGISFRSGTLTAVDIMALLFVLQHANKMYNISNISLTQANIDDVSTEILANFLKTDKTIRYLDLRYNHIKSAGIKAIGEMLATNEVLKDINLDGNNLEDDDFESLRKGLMRNRTLRTLSLEDNLITDEGAVKLTQWIAGKPWWKLLNMADNQISQNGNGRVMGILETEIKNTPRRAQSKFMNHPKKVICQGKNDDSDKYLSAKVVQFSDRSIEEHLVQMLYGSERLQKVVLQTCQLSPDSIAHLKFLSFTCPCLKTIRILGSYISGKEADQQTVDMFESLSFRKHPKSVSIRGCENISLGSTGWETLMKYKSSFTSFTLEGVHILDDDVEMFVKFLKTKSNTTVKLPKLRLKVHSEDQVAKMGRCIGSISTAEALILGEDDLQNQLAPTPTSLKISIPRENLSHIFYKNLNEGMKHNGTVTHLRVSKSANLMPTDIEGFGPVLLQNHYLKYLDLSTLPLTEDLFVSVVGALKSNNTMTHLGIKSCQLKHPAMGTLSEVLQENKSLLSLDISNNCIGDKGIKLISKALNRNQTLQKLQMSSIGLTSKGMKPFCLAIESNRSLLYLDMRDNGISEGALYLYEAVLRNKTLQTLLLHKEDSDLAKEKQWIIIAEHIARNKRGAESHHMKTRGKVSRENKERSVFQREMSCPESNESK